MRIVMGATMYNELSKGHIHKHIANVLNFSYDAVVILDDGSIDGSWDVLKEYEQKHDKIHVFRQEKNSILYNGQNRWVTLMELIAKYEPDWVNIRAADQTYSYPLSVPGGDMLRKRLEEYNDQFIHYVAIPQVHFWRSDWWYRTDWHWGKHSTIQIWRFDENYSFGSNMLKAGTHQGTSSPSFPNINKPVTVGLNREETDDGPPWPATVLHYGLSTHDRIVEKLRWSVESSRRSNRSRGLPRPENLPPVSHWGSVNGWKVAHEFNIKLKIAEQLWFKEPVPKKNKPKIESLYEVIKEFNPARAEEYKNLFDKYVK